MPLLPILTLLLACTPKTPGGGADSGSDSGDAGAPGVRIGPYDATVRWTSYGIPHITAPDYGSLGYGMGYAFARDHACVLADQVLMVNSQRARWFGQDFVDGDFGWKAMGVRQQAEEGWSTLPAQVQDMLVGYAAGYDRWLAEGSLDPRCAGQDWVQPIDHIDLLTYYLGLGLMGSGAVFVDELGSAVPPGYSADSRGGPRAPASDLSVLEPLVHPKLGSNGWAIGRDRSETGRGMLLSNTHFPAEGERKWHESQLTIPGVLDVYGVSLMGVATINIGFNRDVTWTHTVSEAPRFTLAMLTLDPSDPTRYLYDGAYEDMTSSSATIQVLQDDGTVADVTHTLWNSRWGPVMNAPVLGWTTATAIALQDANRDDLAMLRTWFEMNRATSMAELQAAQSGSGGIPWVHTIATDKDGTAFYVDSSSVPNWSSQAEAAYTKWLTVQPLAPLFADYGAILVDGSDPVFQWVDTGETSLPGVVPWSQMPKLERTDFVFNSNDNHWLSNPAQPLEGYPALYGSERSPRTPRTRMNARYLSELGAGSASGEDGKFSLEELQGAALGGRGMIAEELKDEVVARCTGVDSLDVGGTQVPLAPACKVLAGWDGRDTLDQAGPAVWRELLGGGNFVWDDLRDQGALFSTPFDPDAPVDTPTGLAADAPVLDALATAVQNLQAAGFTVDQTLGEEQFQRKDGEPVPFSGGTDLEGNIAVATYSTGNATLLSQEPRSTVVDSTTDLTSDGYQVNYGNSFVMTMEFADDGPHCEAILTYSQSDDPASEHFADQSRVYAEGGFRPCRYEEADVAADTQEELELTHD